MDVDSHITTQLPRQLDRDVAPEKLKASFVPHYLYCRVSQIYWMRVVSFDSGKRVSALAGDSDDDDLPNTYDYTDSFLDDDDVSKGVCLLSCIL